MTCSPGSEWSLASINLVIMNTVNSNIYIYFIHNNAMWDSSLINSAPLGYWPVVLRMRRDMVFCLAEIVTKGNIMNSFTGSEACVILLFVSRCFWDEQLRKMAQPTSGLGIRQASGGQEIMGNQMGTYAFYLRKVELWLLFSLCSCVFLFRRM